MEALLNAKPVLLPLAYLLVALDYGGRFFLGRSATPRSPQVGLRAAILLHVGFLVGLRNRISTMVNWFWSYLTYRSGIRLITGAQVAPGVPATAGNPSVLQSRRAVG